MDDYTLELISTIGARADAGELVPFGWGGSIKDWERRLREHIISEGYGMFASELGGWEAPSRNMYADLPEAPIGCDCEGCRDRMADAAARLSGLGAQAQASRPATFGRRFVMWRHCGLCNKVSARAGFMPDGLCGTCYVAEGDI